MHMHHAHAPCTLCAQFFLRIGERERGAPAAAKNDLPRLDAQQHPQLLDVGDQLRRLIAVEAALGQRAAAAALVEEEHSVVVGVEEASVPLETAGAGAAVQEECWCAGGRAVLLVVELVYTAGHAVRTCVQRLFDGIERPQGDRRVEQSYPAAEPRRPHGAPSWRPPTRKIGNAPKRCTGMAPCARDAFTFYDVNGFLIPHAPSWQNMSGNPVATAFVHEAHELRA